VITVSTEARREEIIRILMGGERTTAPELAAQLGVSERTIFRDLSVLTVERGYPIDTETGRAGGISMRNFRHSHKRILSRIQIKAIETAIALVDLDTAKALQSVLFAYA
jgi:predicted DNA-binding transcriptional regulator YafY